MMNSNFPNDENCKVTNQKHSIKPTDKKKSILRHILINKTFKANNMNNVLKTARSLKIRKIKCSMQRSKDKVDRRVLL